MARSLALVLTVFTGFSGLAYEVAWEKYLATLLGSHSEATAAVLAIFLGGLSVGYRLFGEVTRRLVARADQEGRPPRLLLFYGLVEGGIGVYVVLFPFLFQAVQALSTAIPHGPAGVNFALDVLLAAILIGPPTILMGGTIPILTQALARSLDDATRFHAFVYAFNTAGAFAGALAAGFWLIPSLGLPGLMLAMGTINLVAGAIFVLIGLRPSAVVSLKEGSDAPDISDFAAYAGAALLLGFAMMALQTVLIRLGSLSFGASQFNFSMVVAVFVLCIAFGSMAVSLLPTVRKLYLPIALWALVVVLCLLYTGLDHTPYLAHVLRTFFRSTDETFYPYYTAVFLSLLLVIGPPVFLSGAVLPLLFHQLRRKVGDLGVNAGRLYSWNTVGSLLGALLGGYVLLFWLDLDQVYRVALGALVVAAVLVTMLLYDLAKPILAAALVVPLVVVSLLGSWEHSLLIAGQFRNRAPMPFTYEGIGALRSYLATSRRLLFYMDGPTATVAVTETPPLGGKINRSIVNNGKSDGSTAGDYVTMSLAAIVPALFAEKAERSFVIGYGTGVTAGVLAALDEMQQVDVAEISVGVVRAAPLFDFANHHASTHPKVHIIRSDAYRALLRSDGEYDIVVSEPSNPWVSGVEMLYSREFLEAARERLRPGGVYVQWFHQYETDTASVALVLRTYAEVFDSIAVWFSQSQDLLLLGFMDGESPLDLERLESRTKRKDIVAALGRADLPGLPGLLAHELLPLGVVHAAEADGPTQSLYHPLLNYMAGRAFHRGQRARLPFLGSGEAARVGAENSLVRRWADAHGGKLSDEDRAAIAEELCRWRALQCAALLASWNADDPDSPGLQAAIQSAANAPRRAGAPPDQELLDELRILVSGAEADERRITLKEARRATENYEKYYHHAAPFSEEQLLALWELCKPGAGATSECTRGLERARELLASGLSAQGASVEQGER